MIQGGKKFNVSKIFYLPWKTPVMHNRYVCTYKDKINKKQGFSTFYALKLIKENKAK